MASSKLDGLNLHNKFDYVIKALQNQLKNLDDECTKQVMAGSVSKDDLKAKLEEIDNFIMNNKVIKNAIIEGNEDLKKLIDAVNLEVNDRMESFKGNFSDTEKKDIEKANEDTALRNKRQKEIDVYNSKDISSKDIEIRANEAEQETLKLKSKLDEAEKLDKILDEMIKDGSVKDKNSAKDKLVQEFEEAQRLDKKAEESLNKKATIKNPNDYKDDFDKKVNLVQGKMARGEKLTKEEEKDMISFIEGLSDLDDVEFKELKDCIVEKTDKSGNKEKEIKDFNDLASKLQDDKYDSIDWSEKVNTTKEKYDIETRETLQKILEKDLFRKMYPVETKAYEKALKLPYETDIIKNQMSNAIFAENLKSKLNKIYKDLLNKDSLKNEYKNANLRSKNLNDFNNRQRTSTVKLKKFDNAELQLEENGQKVDFSKIKDEDKESFIEKLYNQFNPTLSADKKKEMNDKYEQESANKNLPVKYEKPNIFRRAWYKLTHPSTWGSGQGLADEIKSAWMENEIKEDIRSGIEKIQADSKFMLTSEQEEEVYKKIKEIEEAQKRKGREDIVNGNLTAKEAYRKAQEEFNKKQKEADEEMKL